MAAKPERGSGDPGASGEPLKPSVEAGVPEAWLVVAGHADLAENVDRLLGDADLVTDMALANYEGPLWEHFSNEIAKYSYAVVGSWVARKLIFERCKSKGLGGLPAIDRDFTADEVQGLTDETVVKALFHFRRDVLIKRKWDPRKGATLRTYFIGQCLIRFPKIYRSWLRTENRELYESTDDVAELDFHAGGVDIVERKVIAGIVASAAMSSVKDPRVRKAMHMIAEGHPQADVARVLGITEKAVERMLANERARLKTRGVG